MRAALFAWMLAASVALVVDAGARQDDASPAAASDEAFPVSSAEVLDVIAEIPAECGLYVTPGCPKGSPGHYDRGPDARAIADAIARHVEGRTEATLAAVFAAYESANNAHAKGDSKAGVFHSFGPWALYDPVSIEAAQDPERAIVQWLKIERDAQTRCMRNPPDERLAVLASGKCEAGRKKVRVRMRVVRELVRRWNERTLPDAPIGRMDP